MPSVSELLVSDVSGETTHYCSISNLDNLELWYIMGTTDHLGFMLQKTQ